MATISSLPAVGLGRLLMWQSLIRIWLNSGDQLAKHSFAELKSAVEKGLRKQD
jgi:hypothetical protein